MGYNRSGRRRTQRLKRAKKLLTRLARKTATAQGTANQAGAAPAKT
jgi:hypothetical protein